MKKAIRIFLTVTVLVTISFTGFGQTAKEIVTKAEDNIRGLSSKMEMNIQIIRPSWTRSMKVKAWSKSEQYSMMIITAPAKDAGTVFLKRIKEIWNWLPGIERVVKLPPSMMSQSWMGTDFTNDDLINSSSIVDDYTHKVIGEEIIDGRNCYKIELDPKPQAAVVWGKI